MISSFIITLREGMEAALIVGLVLAAVHKAGAVSLVRSVWYGTGAAVGVSLVAGVAFALAVGSLPEEVGEAVEGVASVAAVVVLTYMIFWMRRQARHLARDIDDRVRAAAGLGSGWALGTLAFAAVVREGLETALFLYSSVTATEAVAGSLGAALGLIAAVLLGYAVYRGSIRLDLAKFFTATGILLIVLAAGMLAYGLHELQEVGVVPVTVEHLWDMNAILDDGAGAGAFLKGLVGYNGNPSLLEAIAYWLYLGIVGVLFLRPAASTIRPGPLPQS
ncbi:MAG TPA: iron uptake transporter permease EfeU [Thermoleophilia bacterium]|nr:iron uptake transporter permease EfeU [Thermoleophilia bacterium]